MLRNLLVTLLFLATLNSLQPVFSQCITPPPLDSCNGTEPLLGDNEILGAGTKKWYYGATTTYNELTMRGGTLVVCGDITIDKFFMDSGTIIIRPGARFVIGGGIGYGAIFKGNAAVYNYGTFQCIRNLTLDYPFYGVTQPNIIMNVTASSVFKMSNQYFGINNPNSFFVNNGKADFHGITTDPGAGTSSICLGRGSETKMTVLYNRARLPYIAPNGAACVQVTEYSQFYDTLTRSQSINICLGPNHRSDASCMPWGCRPSAWGTTSLFANCNLCPEISILPVSILAFSVTARNQQNELYWKTDMTPGNHIFRIERSGDGKLFNIIDSFALDSLTRDIEFRKTDPYIKKGILYYRIKCVNLQSGLINSSKIIKVQNAYAESVSIYPNPFRKTFRVLFAPEKSPVRLQVLDVSGHIRVDEVLERKGGSFFDVKMPETTNRGTYILKLIYEKDIILRKLISE